MLHFLYEIIYKNDKDNCLNVTYTKFFLFRESEELFYNQLIKVSKIVDDIKPNCLMKQMKRLFIFFFSYNSIY